MRTVSAYTVIEVSPHRWQVNQGSASVGLRLTLYDAIQSAARYTVQEFLAGYDIENPWPIQVERNSVGPVEYPFGVRASDVQTIELRKES